MKIPEVISETFEPVSPDIDTSSRYVDLEMMAESNTARIYRAVNSGKRVIVKTPSDGSAEHLDLLKREYTISKDLDHQNVARVYTWATDTPAGAGIVMEYIDGVTLAEYLKSKPSLNQRLRLFGQLLDGVEYLHQQGITHNDLKPGNIMVTRRNHDVKILDFGYADCDGEFLRRQLGGTAGFASPELRKRSPEVDARSDIYSVGVIMRLMFGSKYSRISGRCCNPDPGKRFANIEALRTALKRRRRRPRVVAACVVAVALAAGALVGNMRYSEMKEQLSGNASSAKVLRDSMDNINSSLHDSINRLNSRLYEINSAAAAEDSLTNIYRGSADSIVAIYAAKVKEGGVRESFIVQCPKLVADVEAFSDRFAEENGAMGRKIVDMNREATIVRNSNDLEKFSQTLPSLRDLISDPMEYSRVFTLVINGQPYRH